MASEPGEVLATRGRAQAADPSDELRRALADGIGALDGSGDLRASRQSFERAYQLAEHCGGVLALADAGLGLAGLWVREGRTVTSAEQLEARLRDALSLLDERSSHALRIRVRLAGEADYASGQSAAILAALDEARTAGDPVALAEALSIAHHCLLGPDHVALRRDLAAELIKTSFRTQRRSDLLMGMLWQTVDSYSAGDPHAGRLLRELREHLKQRNHLAIGFVVSAIDVMLAIRAGRLDEAESLVSICAENGAAAGDADHEWWSGAQLVTIRWYQGRLGELLPALRDRVDSPLLSSVDNSAIAALAVAAALDGDLRTAASSLAALCGGDLAGLPRSSSWLVTMNGIVEAAYLLDDADVAARAYSLLRPYAGLPMIGSLGVTCFGATDQALGVAALTCRQLDRAVDHLRAAVRRNIALGHWPAVAASRQRLAQAYSRRRRHGDSDASRRESDAAAGVAAGLGLPLRGDHGGERTCALAECVRLGRQWRLTAGNRNVLVPDSVGMTHLAVLIANPRQELRAADLAAGLAGLGSTARAAQIAQPVLDHEAVSAYRNRLRRLEAEADGQESRAERDWLVSQLATASGLGGRHRSFPDQDERARVAVGKAIRRALVRITTADAAIGEHLRQSVHTGIRCSYWPS